MIEWLKEFFFHKDAFIGYVRAALLGLGGAQIAGILPESFPKWMGVLAIMAGGFIRAGDKNPKE